MKSLALLLAALLAGCGKSGPPYSARDALKTFRIKPGYKIEVFATEPMIADPVAMEFDEAGRIYVVEDSGYPLDTGRKGRVQLLEDTNGDGRPDRATTFAANLQMPTGVMRWKKGILVTDAPDVLYLEDTNGDGQADVRRVVLTGFPFTNPQHTVNSPVYGLDNWIHLAHENATTPVIFTDKFGDPGSDIRFPHRPDAQVVKTRGRSIRFRPDTGQVEAHSGTSQFGHAFDEFGRYFTMNNSNHQRHEVIAARYLSRNPDLPVATALQDFSDHGAGAEVYPITRNPRFEMLTEAGTMTSACGMTLFQGASFIAEPVHNLVHRDEWSPAGATFTARRSYPRGEFLVSTDAWFRPVNFYVGPDGALYLIDYYRLSIEHPEWTSTATHTSPDLYKGNDLGRIYRIVPERRPGRGPEDLPAPQKVLPAAISDVELVAQLGNPNPWWRRNAQRLLVDHRNQAAVPGLKKLARESTSPVARVHALWTLEGLGKLDTELVARALDDSHPGERENAIVLAESRLPELEPKLLKMTPDPDLRVRFQLLCTLGFLATPAARDARDRLLVAQINDRWVQIAALSASSDEAPRLYEWALARPAGDARASLLRQAASVIGARQKPAEMRKVIASTQSAGVEGLALGLRGKRGPSSPPLQAGQETLIKVFDSGDVPLRRATLGLLEVTGLSAAPAVAAKAAARAADSSATPEVRADSLGLLALAGPAAHEAMLKKLVDPSQPEAVQAAAVGALGRIPGDDVGDYLLGKWRTLTAPARSEAADALLSTPSRARLLVAAIESGAVQAWHLGFRQKRNLLMHRDVALREKARPLLEPKAGEREKVVERYQAALEERSDAARGEAVFKNACAKCHKHKGAGAEVGPDLASVRNRSKQNLLEDILMPNKSIAQNYEAYVVETTAGATIEGVIGPQTSTTLTLRHEDGKEDVIQRSNIKKMYVTNLSAMAADLEHQISVQQMADLLDFLTAK